MFNKKLSRRIDELENKLKNIEENLFKFNHDVIIERKINYFSGDYTYMRPRDVVFSYSYYCKKSQKILTEDFYVNIEKDDNPSYFSMLRAVCYSSIEDLFTIEKIKDNVIKITSKLTNGKILINTDKGESFFLPKEFNICMDEAESK